MLVSVGVVCVVVDGGGAVVDFFGFVGGDAFIAVNCLLLVLVSVAHIIACAGSISCGISLVFVGFLQLKCRFCYRCPLLIVAYMF